MPLFTGTQRQYYDSEISFVTTNAQAGSGIYALTFDPLPTAETEFEVFVDGVERDSSTFSYSSPNVTLNPAVAENAVVVFRQLAQNEQLGNYQYVGIDDLISNFQVNYVGEGKIIKKVKLPEISFHIQRAIAELSYDTLRSEKSQEIDIPPTLRMRLPHDFVSHVKLTWTDSAGIERIMYPARKTSNPSAILQDSNYNYMFDETTGDILYASNSNTWEKYKTNKTEDATDDRKTGEDIADLNLGQRYGIEPELSQNNGSFFIDENKGKIYFSSNMSSQTITLKYISDSLGTDDEMRVHKLAEEAMYKWIIYAIMSTRINVPEYIVARFKKERFAETRKAKLRLSNIKLEEITQVMRGKSKQIKH